MYFVLPTEDNVARICRDLQRRLYGMLGRRHWRPCRVVRCDQPAIADSYQFNFISEIPHVLLERIAKASLEAECATSITKIFDVVR